MHLSQEVCTCAVNQITTVRPLLSLELKNHIPETNSHFTPELSICAAGYLTKSNLAHTPP